MITGVNVNEGASKSLPSMNEDACCLGGVDFVTLVCPTVTFFTLHKNSTMFYFICWFIELSKPI